LPIQALTVTLSIQELLAQAFKGLEAFLILELKGFPVLA
jgi:hypothetical protein